MKTADGGRAERKTPSGWLAGGGNISEAGAEGAGRSQGHQRVTLRLGLVTSALAGAAPGPTSRQ